MVKGCLIFDMPVKIPAIVNREPVSRQTAGRQAAMHQLVILLFSGRLQIAVANRSLILNSASYSPFTIDH
jgi:hypothetical protein